MAPATYRLKKENNPLESSPGFLIPQSPTNNNSSFQQPQQTLMRESDLQLGKTADELRRFFRFCRPGVPDLERKVSYTVEARVPISIEASFEMLRKSSISNLLSLPGTETKTVNISGKKGKLNSNKKNKSPSIDENFLDFLSDKTASILVDVLRPSASSVVVNAIQTLNDKIRSDDTLLSLSDNNNNSNQEDHEGDDDDDDEDEDEENEQDAGNIKIPFSSSSGAEMLAAAQHCGSFVFSRMNSVRNFSLVGDGLHFQMNNNSNKAMNGNSNSSNSNISSANSSRTATTLPGRGVKSEAGGAIDHDNVIHVPNLQKVVPICQTLPLRTHTQRTAKVVHEIALLLALLHELE